MGRTVVIGILLLTLFESRIVWLMHVTEDPQRVRIVEEVYASHPPSRTFQNSILGPYLVHGASEIFHVSRLKALKVFELSMLLAANSLAFWIGGWISREQAGGWALAAVNALVFIVFQHRLWLYPWDLIDAVTMLAFAFAIWADADLIFFVLIFFAELFNRESVCLIPLWLIIDGIFNLRRRKDPRTTLQLITGGILLVVGVVVTLGLRKYLYHPIDPAANTDLVFNGPTIPLLDNLHRMFRPKSVEAVFPAMILTIFAALFFRAVHRRGRRAVPVVIFLGITLLAVSLLATLEETRVWISVAPLALPLIFDRHSDDEIAWS